MDQIKSMFWKDFKTQESARKAIRQIVDPRPFKEPFESELISDLIVERHYFVRLENCDPQGSGNFQAATLTRFKGISATVD